MAYQCTFHHCPVRFSRSWILRLASASLLTYSASKTLLSSATTKGTSSWRLRPMMTLEMKASLSFTSLALMASLASVTSTFLRMESTSFRRFCRSISYPILLFFSSARCRFFRMSISFYSRLSRTCCYSILVFRANTSSILLESSTFSLEFSSICPFSNCWKSAFILGSCAIGTPVLASLANYSSFSSVITRLSRARSAILWLLSQSAYFCQDSSRRSILQTFLSFSYSTTTFCSFQVRLKVSSRSLSSSRATSSSFFLSCCAQEAASTFCASRNSSDLRLLSNSFTCASSFLILSLSLLLMSLISSYRSSMRCLERYSLSSTFSLKAASCSSFSFIVRSNWSHLVFSLSFSAFVALRSASVFSSAAAVWSYFWEIS